MAATARARNSGLDPLCKTVSGFWFTCAADKAMKCGKEGENESGRELETRRSEAQTSPLVWWLLVWREQRREQWPPAMMAGHVSMTRELLKVIEEYVEDR